MPITSISVPLNSSAHVTAIDVDTLANLPPASIVWSDVPGSTLLGSHVLTITADATGFVFAGGNTVASGSVAGTYQGSSHPSAMLAVGIGPNVTHLGFTSP